MKMNVAHPVLAMLLFGAIFLVMLPHAEGRHRSHRRVSIKDKIYTFKILVNLSRIFLER